MRRVRTDRVRPGDLIAGTWAHDWPAPRRVEAIAIAPEHSVAEHAYRLDFTAGDPVVLYGSCQLQLAQRP